MGNLLKKNSDDIIISVKEIQHQLLLSSPESLRKLVEKLKRVNMNKKKTEWTDVNFCEKRSGFV